LSSTIQEAQSSVKLVIYDPGVQSSVTIRHGQFQTDYQMKQESDSPAFGYLLGETVERLLPGKGFSGHGDGSSGRSSRSATGTVLLAEAAVQPRGRFFWPKYLTQIRNSRKYFISLSDSFNLLDHGN